MVATPTTLVKQAREPTETPIAPALSFFLQAREPGESPSPMTTRSFYRLASLYKILVALYKYQCVYVLKPLLP